MNVEIMHLYSKTHNEQFKEITKDWEPKDVWITRHDNNGNASLTLSGPYLPGAAIEELSAAYPEMTFTAVCTSEWDGCGRDNVYEIKAGHVDLVRVATNYYWPSAENINDDREFWPGTTGLLDKKTLQQLRENVTEVFRRIDSVRGKDGKMIPEVYEPETSVTAYCGDWEMKATKIESNIQYIRITNEKAGVCKEYDDRPGRSAEE
jgi:hypothetical protein